MNYKNKENKKNDIQNNNTKIEYRKIQSIVGNVSFSLILPKQYALDLGLQKSDFVKVYLVEDKIIIEKAR